MRYAYLALVSAFLSVPVLATGCALDSGEENQSVGTVRMPLRAFSSEGTEYRLRQATFEITGAQNASVLSEDYQTASVAEVVLSVGNYQVELTGSWQMERVIDGEAEPVEATLVSENPVSFAIQDQGVTSAVFRFEVDGEIVETGEGVLEISIEVDEVVDDPGPDPGTMLFSIVGPGQLPLAAAGLPGDRVAVTSGPAARFAVDESGLVWQSFAQQPNSLGQDIAAGGSGEVLSGGLVGGGQIAVESFSAENGSDLNYIAVGPTNGNSSRPVVGSVPAGGSVYAVGSPGNGVVGRFDALGNLLWMTPGGAAGPARDIEVSSAGTIAALFQQSSGGQASISALDINGSVQSVTFIPVSGTGRAESLQHSAMGQVRAFVSQGSQAVSYLIDTLSGTSLGSTVLATLPAPVVDIEPGADDLLAVATQDSLLHVLDASFAVLYSVSVPGGNIQDVVFLPDSNAVCAVALNGTQSLTSCYAN